MKAIQLRSHVDGSGMLRLAIPVDAAGEDVDVIVVIEQVDPGRSAASQAKRLRPPAFYEKTFGSLREDPLERPDQGSFEEREPLR